MNLRSLSDRALDQRIDKLRAKWRVAYDKARENPGYRDLRPSELRATPADDPVHAIYAEMQAIDAESYAAIDHRDQRARLGSAWVRRERAEW